MAEVAQADQFLIPLLDGTFALGQVFETGAATACIGLTGQTRGRAAPVAPLPLSAFVAVLEVEATPLGTGLWPIIGYDRLPDYSLISGERRARQALALPEPVTDPAVAEALMNAFHGLYPWDGFPDPQFFDRLLLAGTKRPENVRFARDMAT